MNTTTAPINGRTPAEWEAVAVAAEEAAAASRAESAASFERCDTDGFLSQWAGDQMTRQHDARARWARDHGRTRVEILLNLDGTVAVLREGYGQYGAYWILNDAAAARYGKRFVTTSRAQNPERRRAANARKGFKVATAWIPAHAPRLRGSNATALSVWAEPEWDRVAEVEVIDEV